MRSMKGETSWGWGGLPACACAAGLAGKRKRAHGYSLLLTVPGHHHTARPLLASEKKEEKKTARREGMQLRAACRCRRDSRRTASRPGKSTRNGRPPNTAMASTRDRDRKMKIMFFYMVICIMYVCVGAVQGRHRIYAYICEAQSGAGMRLAS